MKRYKYYVAPLRELETGAIEQMIDELNTDFNRYEWRLHTIMADTLIHTMVFEGQRRTDTHTR